MKKTIIFIAMLATMATAHAQWSLDSCINYAVNHSLSVRARQLDRLGGELAVQETKNRFLPTVSAGINQGFSFGRGLTMDNVYANRNTSNTSWQIGAQVPIFQGFQVKRTLEYNKVNLLGLIEQEAATKDDITLNVIAAYLQVLYCGEVKAVALNQLALSKAEYAHQLDRARLGKIAEIDVIQPAAQVATDSLSVVSADNDRRLALLDLAQLLELTDLADFDITALPGDDDPMLLNADDVYAAALINNHAIRAGQYSVAAAERNIAVARTGYWPTLSMSGGIGSSYYKTAGIDGENFGSQMRHNFSQQLGFTLSIPIFDAFATRSAERRARLQLTQAQLQLEQSKLDLFKAIQQAYYQARASQTRIASARVAVDAAQASLDAVTLKYNYEKATATDFEQARTTLAKSQLDLVQATYESRLRNRILAFYANPRP